MKPTSRGGCCTQSRLRFQPRDQLGLTRKHNKYREPECVCREVNLLDQNEQDGLHNHHANSLFHYIPIVHG
ncbi:hypothetical protein AMECASPLE_006030 [Ameca splendens]|uniref:Uncharacterized protein n=1 Tax=Ameca splendens TaxID=208324 RepID=A0ABV0ZJN9_9TELE